MPCLRQASTPVFKSNCWRTVARLIERPSVFMALHSVCSRSGLPGEGAFVHCGEVGHRAGAEAGRVERTDADRAIVDRDAYAAVRGAMIDIAMHGKKSIFLGARRAGHAVDIVMAVALDMGRDQRGEREILLQRDSGLR